MRHFTFPSTEVTCHEQVLMSSTAYSISILDYGLYWHWGQGEIKNHSVESGPALGLVTSVRYVMSELRLDRTPIVILHGISPISIE